MIAATDPQEFIPGGRQQALRHPGPVELARSVQSGSGDDFLLQNFEKVSIVESECTEWWTLRKTPDLLEKHFGKASGRNRTCDLIDQNKSSVSEASNASWSWKSAETSASHKSRRTSDVNALKALQSKRFSNDESKYSGCTHRSFTVSTLGHRANPLMFKSDLDYMEEELFVNGNVVIWSKGLAYKSDEDAIRKILCSYSTPYPVRHALWCNFYCERPVLENHLPDETLACDEPLTPPISCICVIDGKNLRAFTTDNEDFLMALPFQVSRVWNTKFGVLLEREMIDVESKDDVLPVTFSLMHPLDDIKPLAIKHGLSYSLIEDNALQIVFTSENPSMCLVYDGHAGQHVVYKIKRVNSVEWKERTSKSTLPTLSVQSGSSKLRNRMSFWDNYKVSGGGHLAFPSPFNSRAASLASVNSQIPSRSQSPMISISRSQTPARSSVMSASPGLLKSLRNLETNMSAGGDTTRFNTSQTYYNMTPEIYLELVWVDTFTGHYDSNIIGAASKAFISEDLTGQAYLCYLIPSRSQLSIIRMDLTSSNSLMFGMLTSVGAKDAVSIPKLHMLAILEHSGNVVLYSGLTTVGKLHVGGVLAQHVPSPYVMRQNLKQFNSPFPRRSSLLSTSGSLAPDPRFDEHLLSPVLPAVPSVRKPVIHFSFQMEPSSETKVNLCGLKDAVETRITLQYSDGTYYRINLPPLGSSTLVESCLNALRQTMNREAAITLLTRWYSARNAPGPTDLSAEQEWAVFTNLLFQLLGYEDDQVSKASVEPPVTPYSAAKRQRHSSFGTDSDWNSLLKTEQHGEICAHVSSALKLRSEVSGAERDVNPCEIKVNTKSVLFSSIRIIHFTLHLLYEELKLNTLRRKELPLLADFLSKLSNDMGLEEYSIHYWKDFPVQCGLNRSRQPVLKNNLKGATVWRDITNKPESIFQFLYDLLNGNDVVPFPHVCNVNPRTRDVIQLWSTYIFGSRSKEVNFDTLIKHIVPPCKKIDPSALTLSVTRDEAAYKVVRMMTEKTITNRDLESYPVGVNLLLHDAVWQCRENPPSDWPSEAYMLLHRPDLAAQAQITEKEGSAFMKYISQNNLQEVLPTVTQVEEQEDGMEDVDSSLFKLRFPEDLRVSEARRLLQSSRPVPIVLVQRPDVSDHDFIEEQEKHLYAICTRTMALPVGRGMFTLRTASPVITEPLPVPPLCLTGKAPPRGTTVELSHIDTPPTMNLWPMFHNGVANGLRIIPEAHNIDSTWIIFNRPKGNSEVEHAGFLMALGLNGHLQNLAVLNTFDYLSKFQEMISVGILLGLSAAHRGTSNTAMTKMLSIHIEALLPPTSMELDVPQNVQVASLLGVGLLYQGTAHRHMTEILLTEIGRPPGPEMENSVDRESYSLAAGLALGLVMLKQGGKPSGLSDLNVPDTLHYYMVGGNKRPLTGSQKDKYKVPSFQIREVSCVNLDVTAPGATLALGLTYLGSGNKAIAEWMAPPDTLYMLDFVRPDFLMLRILSRALIMWDDIKPTSDWIENQVPDTIRPFCMVKPSLVLDIDYEAMNQAYCNIVAGACFALGLRYAGSGDENAFATLLHFCRMFTSLMGKSIAELAGKPTIETCLNVILVSTAMVMAGTGNLDVMRIVRHLRRRVGVSSSAVVTYGSHLAIHMALGLLFLGGGRFTLSNSPGSVAALICAFYPKFPTHSNDNRYHLQAFRHLYVLAVEPRLVIPKDIMMGRMCYANITVVKLDGTSFSVKGPALIPDLSTLFKVCVEDERYWPVVFERGRNWDQLEKILKSYGCIEVKQRAGCLSYLEDKLGYRTELAHTLTQSSVMPWNPLFKAIISFSSDWTVRHFCDHFLSEHDYVSCGGEAKLKQTLTEEAYDCVTRDKLNILPMYVGLVKTAIEFSKSSSTLQLWQFKLAYTQILKNSFSTNLISSETMLALRQQIVAVFNQLERQLNMRNALNAYLSGSDFGSNENISKQLANFVVFYDIPFNFRVSGETFLQVLSRLQSANLTSEAVGKIVDALNPN